MSERIAGKRRLHMRFMFASSYISISMSFQDSIYIKKPHVNKAIGFYSARSAKLFIGGHLFPSIRMLISLFCFHFHINIFSIVCQYIIKLLNSIFAPAIPVPKGSARMQHIIILLTILPAKWYNSCKAAIDGKRRFPCKAKKLVWSSPCTMQKHKFKNV